MRRSLPAAARAVRVAAHVLVALVAASTVACAGDTADTADRLERAVPVPIGDGPASPLESVLGFSSEPSRRNQQFLTMQRRANEAVVSCMAEAGFEYWVEPVSPAFLLGPRSGDGSRAWVEVNGLGITTSLIDLTRPVAPSVTLDATATNRAYTDALDPAATRAYDLALIGDRTTTDGQFAPDGCWSQAYGDVLVRLAALDEFTPQLESLNARIADDPRVGAAMERWASCMRDLGFDYTDREALIDELFARLLDVEYVQGADGLEFTQPGVVDRLLADEIELATADFDCRSVIAAELDGIRRDYEREFIDDNMARIEARMSEVSQ